MGNGEKIGVPQVVVRSEISLYMGENTGFTVDYELSEEFKVSPSFVFMDVVTKLARVNVLSELPYAYDFLISETIVTQEYVQKMVGGCWGLRFES